MFKNYLVIAWRNIIRHKAYTAINISGLTVGIAACLLLFIVVRYELSYDTFQPNYSRIYHVTAKIKSAEGESYDEGIPYPGYDALRVQFPDVLTGALFQNYNCQVAAFNTNNVNSSSNKKFIEKNTVFFSDPNFFSIFKYKWLTGNAQVLKNPNTAVITKKMAEKYFGSWQSAMGELLKIDNTAIVKIEGILNDAPANTDFPTGVIASYETMKKYPDIYGYTDRWGSVTSSFQAFMLLPQNVSAGIINKRLITFSNEHFNADKKDIFKTFEFLQPLSDIHFDTQIGNSVITSQAAQLCGHSHSLASLLLSWLVSTLLIFQQRRQ